MIYEWEVQPGYTVSFRSAWGMTERHLSSENADAEWERVLQGCSGKKLSTDIHRRQQVHFRS